jgi:thiol-disulfide isomerase/thioredoxin
MKLLLISLLAVLLGFATRHPKAATEANPRSSATSASTVPATTESVPETTLQGLNGNQVSWDNLIVSYKGKVVYVDIWASWCGPCRQQAPAYQALKTKFAADAVVFLSISVDAESKDWTDALTDLGEASDPNNFLLLDGHHSGLNATLHIKGIPRYVLIDKSGKMVNKDAPFPSDVAIEGIIKGML